MAEGVHASRVIRFGIFEVDLQSGELRKAGLKLKLTGQPFQVLAILLEHPGKVVTREDLQKRLWPDTFVDIDHNLNTAINKIREALDDSAASPRSVETLPRRGYRFIGPINHENAKASVGADSERLKGDSASGKTVAVDAVTPAASLKFRWLGVLAAVIVILAIAATLVWLRLPQTPPRVLATTQLTKDGVSKSALLTDGSRLYIGETKGRASSLCKHPSREARHRRFPPLSPLWVSWISLPIILSSWWEILLITSPRSFGHSHFPADHPAGLPTCRVMPVRGPRMATN
jgi:DNA-binding winged helix-turn-helix (wHTH) protein